MFDSIIAKIVLGWIRHAVLGFGALLAHKGLLTSDQATTFTGAIMVIVPLAFSAYDKWQAQQKQNAAVLAAAQSNVVQGKPQ